MMSSFKRLTAPSMLARIYLCYALFTGLLLVIITPPFQTPDAVNHFYRATQVAEGHWFATRYVGTSGGEIDSSAVDFANLFTPLIFGRGAKVERAMLEQAASIHWSGVLRKAEFPNTAIYPPYTYLPQVVGIKIGQTVGLSVSRTYTLACLLGLLASTILTWCAIRTGRRVALAIFVVALLPISSMVFSSMSQETLVFPVAFLLVAYLDRSIERASVMTTRALALIGLALVLCISARPPYAGLLLLLFCPGLKLRADGFGWVRRGVACLLIGMVSAAAAWLFSAAAWAPVPPPRSMSGQMAYLLLHPEAIFEIARATVRANGIFYLQSFVGILGWLNVYLAPRYYIAAGFAGILAGIWSACASPNTGAHSNGDRVWLIVSALMCVGMIFGALYLTWTPVQAPIVEGVQGRYFVPLVPLIGLALAGAAPIGELTRGGIIASRLLAVGLLSVLLLPIYTYAQAASSLIGYYYVR